MTRKPKHVTVVVFVVIVEKQAGDNSQTAHSLLVRFSVLAIVISVDFVVGQTFLLSGFVKGGLNYIYYTLQYNIVYRFTLLRILCSRTERVKMNR